MQQSLFYQGTGRVLQSLHVQVRRRGDDAPTLLGELVSMELCSQREVRISVLPGVHKPEQFTAEAQGLQILVGAVCASLEQSLWYPSAEGADSQFSALLPSKPNSAVGGLTLT